LRQIKAQPTLPQHPAPDKEDPPMDIASDKVAEIIILARDLDDREAEFDAFIDTLNEDEQAALVALMWVGRGTFEPEDYAEALATARHEATTPTADYLKGSLHLSEHLETALELMGIDPTVAEDAVY
jgi:hypothetical protein